MREGVNGGIDADLSRAALRALQVEPAGCVAFAAGHSWERCTRQFLGYLDVRPPAGGA